MAPPITIKDIAEKANVHHSTVSLCLKNSPRISAATRERVLKVAREIGYHPHPFVSTLMHARRRGRISAGTPPLAFVHVYEPGRSWKEWIPELRLCLDQARQQARARGFRLEEFSATIDETQRLGNILYTRGIKGVILAPLRRPIETLPWQWERLAVVALGPSLIEPCVHRVRHHHFQAMLTAMDECHRLGYRRVGFALKESVSRKTEHRWLGSFLLKQREFSIPDPPQALLAHSWNRETFLAWLEKERPDAVIGGRENIAEWLKEAHFKIPNDIGFVALNASISGRESGINQNWAMQGGRAVTLLIALLNDNLLGLQSVPNILLVSGSWIPGKTVRAQSPSAKCSKEPPPPTPLHRESRASEKISLKEIARKARVHSSTASLCLGNSPLVAEKTRLRVKKIAQSMGYRPHPHLSALMRIRRRGLHPGEPPTIAFVTSSPSTTARNIQSTCLRRCIEGARRRAEATGFRLEVIHDSFARLSSHDLAEELQSRGFSGVILAPLFQRFECPDRQCHPLATVAIGPGLGEPRMHRVRSNHFKTMTMAMENCRRLGYRRIGVAFSEEASRQVDNRWLGAHLTPQVDRQAENPPRLLLAKSWTEAIFSRWIKKNRPEVVIVSQAGEPRRWLESAGYTIPRDIGLVALNVASQGCRDSGIFENWGMQGERAISMLNDLLLDNELGLQKTPNISLVDGAWNPGKTVRMQTVTKPMRCIENGGR